MKALDTMNGRTFRIMTDGERAGLVTLGVFPPEAADGFVLVDQAEERLLQAGAARKLDSVYHLFASKAAFDALFFKDGGKLASQQADKLGS